MSYFNEKFYTDDFDQEMLDFVEKNYRLSVSERSLDSRYLRYGNSSDYFWTDDYDCIYQVYKYLTRQQFKEKIGMTTKTFTKADLVAGKHVVRVREGLDDSPLYLVLDEVLVNSSGREGLYNYTDCLKNINYNGFDIVEVFQIVKISLLDIDSMTLSSIWKREEKSEAKIQFEKLQQQITELQAQADKLKATL